MKQPVARGVDERLHTIVPYHIHGKGESPAHLQVVQRENTARRLVFGSIHADGEGLVLCYLWTARARHHLYMFPLSRLAGSRHS